MIWPMDTPEASIASFWETLAISPWWKTILIIVILIILFLLFAPCICNCITGFVSNHMKAFKLQMIAQTCATAVASCNYYLGPLDQKSSVWGLGETLPGQFRDNGPCQLRSSYGMRTTLLFPRQHNSPKRKGGNERVTGIKARGLQMEEIGCKCQTFFSLLSGRRKQTSDIYFLPYTNLKGGFS